MRNYSVGLQYTSNGDGTCYVSGIGSCTDSDIVIPPVSENGEIVTAIGDYAFEGSTNLKTVIISNGLLKIGECAFFNCFGLTSISIPNSVKEIGSTAFAYTGITSITLPEGLETISNSMFANTPLKSIKMPQSVTTIDDYAFMYCGLTSIEIPDSVTYIGDCAFDYCYELINIYYTSTEEKWAAINISEYNDQLKTATIHYNYAPQE